MLDLAVFAAFLVYAWAGIDTRLIHYWQAPAFYTVPEFLQEFLRYPGGPADALYALIAQAYASQGWGALVLTLQVAAVAALTHACFALLAGKPVPFVRFAPLAPLLYFANIYFDRTPVMLGLIVGLGLGLAFARLARRWGEWVAVAAFLPMTALVYYATGIGVVFFAISAVLSGIKRRARLPVWIAYAPLAAAMPLGLELSRRVYVPVSAKFWFTGADVRPVAVFWALFVIYAAGGLAAIWLAGRKRSPETKKAKRFARFVPVAAAVLVLLGLASAAAASYRLNARDKRMAIVNYYGSREDWPAVLQASAKLHTAEFNSLNSYEMNLALHEMHRLGDEMFRYPQGGRMLLDLRIHPFMPYMVKLTDLCLRLGRVNDAEHYGSEAMVAAHGDPAVYRLMARIKLVKGQTAAARRFLTLLSSNVGSGRWARETLNALDRDPGTTDLEPLRRRMLTTDDMMSVWQRGDQQGADMERLLLNQLEQDPSNRMAFEFLMGTYLLSRNLEGARALMPRIKDMPGPAYTGADGRRRTPRHYQEAMALYSSVTGASVTLEGLEIQPETLNRLSTFKWMMQQARSRDAALQAAWEGFRDTYFFYATFGPGDYR